MDLPAPFVLHLYLYSLGLSYRTLEAVVSVLSPAQRTLSHVMKLAVDHTAPDHDDEAVNHTALIAELKTEVNNLKKRTAEQAFAAHAHQIADKHQLPICGNCHKPGHTKEQCFAPGGGLSHYTPLQRQEFLFNKRKVRFEQYQKKHNDAAQNKETAAEATDERDSQIRKLQHQIQELGYVPDVL